MTTVYGNKTYATDGQVISGLDIHGSVTITGRNVTLRNAIVRGTSTAGCQVTAVIRVEPGASAAIIDSEVNPTYPTPCLDGVWATNTTLSRVNIHGAVDGVKANDNTVVQNSYIHDLRYYGPGQNPGGGSSHNDAVQTFHANEHIRLVHNYFALSNRDNATYQLTQDEHYPAKDIRIEDNWLYGGGCTLNLSSKGGSPITASSGIYVLNNRFGTSAYDNCPILLSENVALTELRGNVWDSTGKPIPPPQVHN